LEAILSGKNQAPCVINWQSTDPRTNFLPLNANTQGKGSVPSGTLAGTMATTATIYSNILDVSRMDNIGFEIAWSGTPTGTLSVVTSNSAINWNALTFSNPTLAQPNGSAAGMSISLNQLPFKYVLLIYTNASGSGSLTVYNQVKDLN
jgi:hypothetical protein